MTSRLQSILLFVALIVFSSVSGGFAQDEPDVPDVPNLGPSPGQEATCIIAHHTPCECAYLGCFEKNQLLGIYTAMEVTHHLGPLVVKRNRGMDTEAVLIRHKPTECFTLDCNKPTCDVDTTTTEGGSILKLNSASSVDCEVDSRIQTYQPIPTVSVKSLGPVEIEDMEFTTFTGTASELKFTKVIVTGTATITSDKAAKYDIEGDSVIAALTIVETGTASSTMVGVAAAKVGVLTYTAAVAPSLNLADCFTTLNLNFANGVVTAATASFRVAALTRPESEEENAKYQITYDAGAASDAAITVSVNPCQTVFVVETVVEGCTRGTVILENNVSVIETEGTEHLRLDVCTADINLVAVAGDATCATDPTGQSKAASQSARFRPKAV